MSGPTIDPADLTEFIGQVAEPPRVARYAVDAGMIRNWVEALDDRNPVYVDDEAARRSGRERAVTPPAMISTWVMAGYRRWREVQASRANEQPDGTAYGQLMGMLDAAGFTSVVATDLEQEYHREVAVGTRVTCHFAIDSVHGPKTTSLGEGWFITLAKRYVDQHEELLVTEKFRLLRFAPKTAA